MGIFDFLEEKNDQAVDALNSGADSIGGIIGGLFGGRGASSAAAESPGSSPDDDNERWRQSLIGDAQRRAEKQRIESEYGPGQEAIPETAEDRARLGLLNVQTATAQANLEKIKSEMAQANSPEARALLQTQLTTAQTSLKRAELELSKALTEMSPEAQIRLRDELDTRRARLSADLAAAQSDKEYERLIAREEMAFTRQSARDDKQFGRDLMRDSMRLGVDVRGQELQRLKAQDDFVMNMLQNQISAGRLSLDKAAKQFEAYVTKARLPSEIMSNVSRAVEPLLPYMTSGKAGDIPLGFESGGSRDIIGRLGGNSPTAHDPSKYALKPVEVDPFKLAKQAGADFSQTKVPNPGSVFGGVNVPNVPSGGTSATAGLGDPSAFMGQMAGMQQQMMGQGNVRSQQPLGVGALPPGVGPSPEESQQLMRALGG